MDTTESSSEVTPRSQTPHRSVNDSAEKICCIYFVKGFFTPIVFRETGSRNFLLCFNDYNSVGSKIHGQKNLCVKQSILVKILTFKSKNGLVQRTIIMG